MNADRIDQLLRRAAEDVNVAVRSATPPPLDDLVGRRSRPTAWVSMVCMVLLVAAGVGLVLLGDRDDVIAPAAPPTAVVATSTAGESLGHPCHLVVGISRTLQDPPESIAAWSDLGVRIGELQAMVSAEDASDPSVRRYDRFVALARQAAELGAAGGFTPAVLPANDALAVAEDLIDFVAVPECEFRRSIDDSTGG